MIEVTIGELIKKKRKSLGLTQAKTCEGICEPETFSRIENNKQTPSRSMLNALLQRLEIDDLGVANWYVKDVLFPKFIFKYISDYKNWTGTNISFEKAQRMRCFNAINSQEYAKLVHKMVKKLYENISITCNRYITNIDFPVVKIDALELSMPFVFIKFNINSDEYSILLDNIINEVEKEGVFLHYRNSFGFRFPSIEYIKDFKTKDCVMKVCAGVFEGATFNCLLGLLNDFGRGNISKTHINVIKGIESWKEYLAEG